MLPDLCTDLISAAASIDRLDLLYPLPVYNLLLSYCVTYFRYETIPWDNLQLEEERVKLEVFRDMYLQSMYVSWHGNSIR